MVPPSLQQFLRSHDFISLTRHHSFYSDDSTEWEQVVMAEFTDIVVNTHHGFDSWRTYYAYLLYMFRYPRSNNNFTTTCTHTTLGVVLTSCSVIGAVMTAGLLAPLSVLCAYFGCIDPWIEYHNREYFPITPEPVLNYVRGYLFDVISPLSFAHYDFFTITFDPRRINLDLQPFHISRYEDGPEDYSFIVFEYQGIRYAFVIDIYERGYEDPLPELNGEHKVMIYSTCVYPKFTRFLKRSYKIQPTVILYRLPGHLNT